MLFQHSRKKCKGDEIHANVRHTTAWKPILPAACASQVGEVTYFSGIRRRSPQYISLSRCVGDKENVLRIIRRNAGVGAISGKIKKLHEMARK